MKAAVGLDYSALSYDLGRISSVRQQVVPTAPIPLEVVEFLRQPNPAVVASLRADGSPHTAATWYDLEEDGHVLLNMDESRRRLDFMRRDPRVTLTALGHEDWGRYVTLFGGIVRIEPDADLAGIDRLAIRYAGVPFRARDARRYSAWMKVVSWYGWDGSGPWPTP